MPYVIGTGHVNVYAVLPMFQSETPLLCSTTRGSSAPSDDLHTAVGNTPLQLLDLVIHFLTTTFVA